MMKQDWENLTLERRERVLRVGFDAGAGNVFHFELMKELIELARRLEDDSELSAIVLHGQREVFSIGLDLGVMHPAPIEEMGLGAWRKCMQLGPRMCEAWERLEPITIAAIEGWCVGAGVALAVACDFRVVAENATFYAPEIERGINMSWGSVPRTVALIGPARTKRLFALSEKCDARRALAWGLADEAAPGGETLKAALKLAKRAASMPPIPQRMCKQSINAAALAPGRASCHMDTDQLLLTQSSEDFREGIASFLQKRRPLFKGR